MGRVIVEAMAAGTPTVASAVGGIPDLVQSKRTSLLVPPGDPEALARSLVSLATTPELGRRLAQQAMARVGPAHSQESMAANLLTLYREVLAEPALTSSV